MIIKVVAVRDALYDLNEFVELRDTEIKYVIVPDLDIQKLVKRMVAARPDRISMEQVDNFAHPNNNYHNNNFRRSPILSSYSVPRNCSIEIIYFSIQLFRHIADHVNLFTRLRHFQARERLLLMVSDGARKAHAVVRMYHNSVFLGDTTLERDWYSRLYHF